MKRTFLMTVATAALIAGAGLASAQDKQQMPRTGAAPAPTAQQAAPAEKSAAPMTQGAGAGASAQGAASTETKIDKPAAAQDKAKDRSRSAQDQKSKSMDKSAQSPDLKAKTDSKMSSDTKASSDSKSATDTKTEQRSTTGQGAAATSASVNLSTEQRTKITTVIRSQKVQPLTNVNFSISIGSRVPRTVRFHPLPTAVIEVYPEWRGYEYILVGNEILVINPRTYEIVFILEA